MNSAPKKSNYTKLIQTETFYSFKNTC